MTIKNIILYSSKLPPKYIGGIETNAFYMIRMLQQSAAYNLYVITKGKSRFYRRFQAVGEGEHLCKAYLLDRKGAKAESEVSKTFATSGFKPEETLIYHNTLDLHSYFASLKAAGYRQVARSGGNDIFYHGRKDKSERQRFLHNLSALDRLILNSDYSYKRSIETGIQKEKLVVIKGGCEKSGTATTSTKAMNSECPLIITCGRLVDFKGIEDAIDAMKQLKDKGLKFRFHIIGDGPLQEDLQKQINGHQLGNYCSLLGKQPPEKIPFYYAQASLYLSSSKDIEKMGDGYNYTHTETMGRSVCEAQAHGVPVVSTDAGGTPEMLRHEETGLVVPQNNPAAMADAIERLIANPALIQKYSKNAEDLASTEFSWDKVFHDTCRVFETLDSEQCYERV